MLNVMLDVRYPETELSSSVYSGGTEISWTLAPLLKGKSSEVTHRHRTEDKKSAVFHNGNEISLQHLSSPTPSKRSAALLFTHFLAPMKEKNGSTATRVKNTMLGGTVPCFQFRQAALSS